MPPPPLRNDCRLQSPSQPRPWTCGPGAGFGSRICRYSSSFSTAMKVTQRTQLHGTQRILHLFDLLGRSSALRQTKNPLYGAGPQRAKKTRCSGPHSSSFSTAMKASVGSCTVPNVRIFFLPSFCFSRSFFFRLISPP